MGILQTIGRTLGLTKAAASVGMPSASGIIPALGSMPTASGLLVSQATAMTVSTVYRCVRIRAQDFARCRPKLMTRENGRDIEVTDHPVARLLRRPNRIQTPFGFWEQMTAGRLLRGNSYSAILRKRDHTPTELITINPDAVLVLEATDGSIFYSTNRLGLFQIALLQGLPMSIPAEDMLHIRELSFNMLSGVSPIGLARDEIALSMAMTQQASRFAGTGARPAGILKTDKQLNEESSARLRSAWRNFVDGIQNTGSTLVLEDGFDWKSLDLAGTTPQFQKDRESQVLEVARYFGVPPYKLGTADSLRGVDLTKIDQIYVNEVVAPDLERVEQQLNLAFDLEDEGLFIKFDEAALLRADVSTRYNTHRIGVMTGILTPNEARRAEGLPPLEGGDRLLVPANTAALGSDMTGTAPDGAGRPAAGTLPAAEVNTSGDQPGTETLANPADPAPGKDLSA